MSACPCKGHPHRCFNHPHDCGCTDEIERLRARVLALELQCVNYQLDGRDCTLRDRLAEIENLVDRYAGTYGNEITPQHALMEIAKVLDRWRTPDSAARPRPLDEVHQIDQDIAESESGGQP